MIFFYIPSLIGLLINLQTDLSTLQKWFETWQKEFNPTKCEHLQITNKHYFIETHYTLYSHTIQKVTNPKNLEITFDCHLYWKKHINTIAAKANAAQVFYDETPLSVQLRSRYTYTCMTNYGHHILYMT